MKRIKPKIAGLIGISFCVISWGDSSKCSKFLAKDLPILALEELHSDGLTYLSELREIVGLVPMVFPTEPLVILTAPFSSPEEQNRAKGHARSRLVVAEDLSEKVSASYTCGLRKSESIRSQTQSLARILDPRAQTAFAGCLSAGLVIAGCSLACWKPWIGGIIAGAGVYLRFGQYALDQKLYAQFNAQELESAFHFFSTVEKNIDAKLTRQPQDRTLQTNEVMVLTARHRSYSLDIFFFFNADDRPRLIIVRRAPDDKRASDFLYSTAFQP